MITNKNKCIQITKKFWAYKNRSQTKMNQRNKKNKGNNFLRAQKLLTRWKSFWYFIYAQTFSVKKKKKFVEIVLITSFTILLLTNVTQLIFCNCQHLSFGWPTGYSPSIASILWIYSKFLKKLGLKLYIHFLVRII